MAVTIVVGFALEYLCAVSSLATFDGLYGALGTLATVRASLEGLVDQALDATVWRVIAMIQESVDMVYISIVVALAVTKIVELLNDGAPD